MGNGLGEHPKAGIQGRSNLDIWCLGVKKPFGAGGEN
jgi:hypothetical protein